MKNLWTARREVLAQIRAAPHVLLLLDYDGTLVPIRPTSGLARLSPKREKILAQLTRLSGFKVGLLTGRSLKDIRRAVKVPDLFYAASYGLAIIATPKRSWIHPGAHRRIVPLKKMLPRLQRLPSRFRGVRIEDKTLTVAVHYRQYEGRPGRLKNRLEEIIRAWPGAFTLKTGKKIFEVYPAVRWDKGRALSKIQSLLGFQKRPRIIFFGDDRADEEAFGKMRDNDISVAVGRSKKTKARFFCRDSGEVTRFLKRLLKSEAGARNRTSAPEHVLV